jgi:hypothetical protein
MASSPPGAFPGRAVEDAERVAQVLIEDRVVLDHGGDGGVAGYRRTEDPQAEPAASAAFHELQRACSLQQPQRSLFVEAGLAGDLSGGAGSLREQVEQAEAQAAQQSLRVDEPGANVEEPAGAPQRDGAGKRKGRGPLLEARAGEGGIPPGQQPVQRPVQKACRPGRAA